MGVETITKADLQNVIIGATFLGSGGGGSYQGSAKLLSSLAPTVTFQVPQVWDLNPQEWILENALIGSPEDFIQNPTFQGAVNAFQTATLYAQQQKALGSAYYQSFNGFSAFFPVEAGAVNLLAPFLVAAQIGGGLTVINCDGAGRSVPLLNLLDYAGNLPLGTTTPVIMCSDYLSDTKTYYPAIYHVQDETDAETVAGALLGCQGYNGVCGLAMYPTPASVLMSNKNYYVPWTVSMARDLGVAIAQNYPGNARITAVLRVMNTYNRPTASVIFQGAIESITQSTQTLDYGTIVISDGNGSYMTICFENENCYAYIKPNNKPPTPQDTPVIMGPDPICFLITNVTVPVVADNSDLYNLYHPNPPNPLIEVAVIGVQAVPSQNSWPSLSASAIVKNWETNYPDMGPYQGKYIPFQGGGK